MAHQQWAPYGWASFNQRPPTMQEQQNMFLLSPPSIMSPIMVMSPTPADNMMQRPHSVAYGAPPVMYPLVNFNWQRSQQSQQPQPPDVTSQEHHVSGLLFRPDLVQPNYSNEQPTYANDQTEQPSYANTLDQRKARGTSLPPVIKANEWAPKPPPRSKRSSRMGSRSSLADSVNSIDVTVLTAKLNQLAVKSDPEPVPQPPPRRPPRRKKGKLKNSATLPRDFGGLHSIAEYDLENDHDKVKPLIPQPMDPIESMADSKLDPKPSVPMPSGSSSSSDAAEAPVVPMPAAAPSPNEAVNNEKPTIPQPDGLLQSDHVGKVEKTYFSVTLPMPVRRRESHSRLERSRTTSLQSIRDEIIDGLQKMGENVSVLKQGVVKIYEDLKPPIPTYAQPQPRKSRDTEKKQENPYETVTFGNEQLVVPLIAQEKPQEELPTTLVDNAAIQEDNADRAFRAAFFGIDTYQDELEDEGDVTPTGEEEENEEKPQGEPVIPQQSKSQEPDEACKEDEDSSTEEILSDTETIDVSMDIDEQSLASAGKSREQKAEKEYEDNRDNYNELMYKAVGASWDEIEVETGTGLPPPLALHSNIHSLKLDLLSSIFQNLYPTEQDCALVRGFLSCPASLEEKYAMIRLADLLKKNKRVGIELEDIAEAMSQLANIGSELLRPEDDRDPLWRSIPVAKEIMVTKGIASRAPWEKIQGGSEILESLGYTEYTGFALQYPRSVAPEFFADHIGNLTVELVLASVEISTLLIRLPPTLETLSILREAEAFPGNEPEVYYPEVPMLSNKSAVENKTEEEVAKDDEVERKKESSFMTATVSLLQSRDVRAASMPAFGAHEQVQQPGTSGVTSRRHANESDYEEIGPPPNNGNRSMTVVPPSHPQQHNGNQTCDLCGTTAAIVKCGACSNQIFCLSCDDMYHRHPRRTSHSRKALAQARNNSSPVRPPLPPKGMETLTPVAPPRKNIRKGSAPDSPVTPHRHNELPLPSRSSTLPRKMGSMVGRPLPPPPPPTNEGRVPPPPITSQAPPPPLPAKTPNLGPQPAPPQQHAFYPNAMNDHNMRKMSTTSQPPMHLQFPTAAPSTFHRPDIPLPGYPMPPVMNGNQPFIDPTTGMPRYPPQSVADMSFANKSLMSNGRNREAQPSWKNNPYLEEMEFPMRGSNAMNGFSDKPQQSNNKKQRMAPSQRSKFYRLNKSSSLHDLAHEEMNGRVDPTGGAGISWVDEPWNTTQSTMNQPTMNMQELLEQQRNFRRASSTKSLHQNEDMWSAAAATGSNMWTANPMMQPMMNPMLFAAAMGNNGNQMPLSHQMPNSLHRSMHELHIDRAPSPTMSQKSKKSTRSDRFHNRMNKNRKSSNEMHKPASRPQSRNQSRGQQSRNKGNAVDKHHRGYRESSRTRFTRRRSISTEDDMDSEEVMVNDLDEVNMDDDDDEDEDFFTGESDNDFLSISSGSNSKRAPRKSWTCEHCTYVNNPGVAVCSMCCRTSKQSRGEEYNERTASRASMRKKKSHRNKFDSESEDESEMRHKRASDSRTNSLKRKSHKLESKKNKHAKSPVPDFPPSDPDDDAINEYYAVRHMDNRRRLDSEGRCESSSETSSMHNNPLRKPNLDAPAPAKGILKKSNSNPQLTKLEQGAKNIGPPGRVVDIKKYLAQGPPPQTDMSNDIWQREKNEWMRQNGALPPSPPKQQELDPEYLSDGDDVVSNSSTTNNVGRPSMTRSVSGHSLGDLEYLQQQYDQQQGKISSNRRTSDVGGKRNFRSKRFSRNLEREPAMRRAQSLHMDRRGMEEDMTLLRRPAKQHSSGSSGPEDAMHFTATVHTSGPQEMTGSYLARQEFGGEGMGDSGYMSHSSGGNTAQTKTTSALRAPMESFTMSVDRGYLGRAPGDRDPQLHRSMDDLAFQKTKGLELVRLLREAEQSGFTAEDVQVALNHCGDANPVSWLKDNWDNMMETVVTLASNVGHEAEENTIGTLSKPEAKEALRKHKGNIWAAVTECVEQRQMKYDQLCGKGSFAREDIVTVLTANQGNVEAAFQELNKVQLKPFLMRIWGQGDSGEVASGQQPTDANLSDSPVTGAGDDNVAIAANEVTATKHNNDSSSSLVGETVSHADNDRKKNGSIGEARENYKFDREVRKLLAEGKIPSYDKGEIVVKLIERGIAEEEALLAASRCRDVDEAEDLLHQECQLCMNVMKITEVVNLPNCQHNCCQDCFGKHFTIAIKDRNISEATCPFCMEPKGLADDDDLAADFFAKLDVLIKPIVDQDVHDLFQRKIRDRTLMKDPNFKWCYKCSSGFIADPRNKKLVCPDCRAMSCAKCLLPWETTHEGLSCEDFATWKEANDPDNQAKGVEKHLQEHGIQCPSCKFRYALTKGGCMHFTCTQCKFEFCVGCERPFKMGVKCGKGPACAKMGLHAHHPRNCLFYLRDKEPQDLQRLLKNNNIDYKTDMPEEFKGQILVRCRVQVQKETADGLADDLCNEIAPRNYAGYCKVHYTEYLCGLLFRNNVDPVSLLDLGELKQVFARANHFMPKQRPGEYEFQYKKRLAQLIATEVPLENA